MIRRINFFAGPGSGKSTLSAWLFARMKQEQFNVELVQEYVKEWAYEGKSPTSFDQIYLFAKQMRREDIVLRNGVKHIISDSPLFLSSCYAKRYTDKKLADCLIEMCKIIENQYPSVNIFINRKGKPYIKEGRFQTHEEAIDMDNFISNELEQNQLQYTKFDYTDSENIFNFIRTSLMK